MKNLNLDSIILVFFFKNDLQKPKIIFNDIKEKLNFLNGVKIEFPDVTDIPTEIPVLIYKSLNDEFICQISKNRIDFLFNNPSQNTSLHYNLDTINSQINSIIEYVSQKQSINRIGLIATYFYKSNNPIEILKTKYFNNSPHLTNVSELSTRFNNVFQVEEIQMNDVVNIDAGITKEIFNDDGTTENIQGLSIVRDINNIISNTSNLDKKTLLEVYSHIYPKFKITSIESLI